MIDLAQATPVAFAYVVDRAKAVAWYRDTLGLTLRGSDDYGEFFQLGSGLLRLTAMPDAKPSGHPVFGWDVADLDAVVADLKTRGIVMTIYDGMVMLADGVLTAPDGDKMAWFNDPEGHAIMLSQIVSLTSRGAGG